MSNLQVVRNISEPNTNQICSKFSFAKIDRLVIHLSDCIKIIPTEKIEFIQASSNYSIIHITDGSQIMTSKTLKLLSEPLGEHFVRTHKSFLVNIKYIEEYRYKCSQLTMQSSKKVLVSRVNKKLMKEILN